MNPNENHALHAQIAEANRANGESVEARCRIQRSGGEKWINTTSSPVISIRAAKIS